MLTFTLRLKKKDNINAFAKLLNNMDSQSFAFVIYEHKLYLKYAKSSEINTTDYNVETNEFPCLFLHHKAKYYNIACHAVSILNYSIARQAKLFVAVDKFENLVTFEIHSDADNINAIEEFANLVGCSSYSVK